MIKIINIKYFYFIMVLVAAGSITSCQPDEIGSGNGLADPEVDATFTVTPVEGQPNNFTLQAATENVISSMWNTGDGFYTGDTTEELFLPDAGTYTIYHTAIGRGGETNTVSQEVVVAQSDPVAGNLVKGGKFQNDEDRNQWTVLNISDSGTIWTFNDGSATVTGGGYNQQAIYQAIEVQANKEYTIDMKVWGSGALNTWFEVYASTTPPVQNQDYSADGRRMGLSTWDGCANGAFEGKLSIVGCVGSGNKVTFDQSGTIYLLMKSGGESLGSTGISITNVEMRGSN
ncbi:hypothetical protein ACH3PA_02470 [Leeuwenhoekiella sp. A2]|uniref:hypothetical protein n=1 Tax=Leeuwenhoekiella sp. A2 TaxID=3141460 RepID=UPI003A7F990F